MFWLGCFEWYCIAYVHSIILASIFKAFVYNTCYLFHFKIGAKYEEENEKDLKDQMDFPSQPKVPSQLS